MPTELKIALGADVKAERNFKSFSPSAKKAYYRWILRAKQAGTREKRVRQIVKAAEERSKSIFGPMSKTNS